MRKQSLNVVAIATLAVAALSFGCTKQYIPNTEIEDVAFNREVIDVIERYRHGVEDRNIGLILSLASPRYYDNAGTREAEDDLDVKGLEAVLKERFDWIKSIRYEVRYRDLYEMDGVVYVEVVYTMSYEYELNGETKWGNKTADNRFKLEPVDGGYLFLSGM